ncbi:MAG TPA: hypothetical protein VIM53_04345 [Candidatus Saccharimonadales bacterium]
MSHTKYNGQKKMTAKEETSSKKLSRLWQPYRSWRSFSVGRPRVASGIKFAVLWAFFTFVAWRKLDPDFGWHLQAGNYIRAHGIPAHDIFTYTARQFRWIDHEWGNDVIVSFLYGHGGYVLTSLLYGAIWSGALLVNNVRARLGVLLVAAVAVTPYAGVRPVAWTALFLAVTLRALASKRPRLVWFVPFLFIVWANLHAGFVIGLVIIAYTALYRRRLALLGVFVLCALATFVNAYGPQLYVEVARTLFDPALHSEIVEWMPFLFPTPSLLFIIFWIAGLTLFEKRTLKEWLRPSTVVLAAAASASRNVPLFVVAGVGELDAFITLLTKTLPARFNRGAKIFASVFVLGTIAVICYGAYLCLWPLRMPRDELYPAAAVSYLQANGCEGGHIFNDYTFGGYLIWKLPAQPVYIDGRMPSWRNPSGQTYYAEYLAVLEHPKQYQREFQRYDIRCSLLEKTSINISLIRQLQHDGWQTAVQTQSYILQMAPRGKTN